MLPFLLLDHLALILIGLFLAVQNSGSEEDLEQQADITWELMTYGLGMDLLKVLEQAA